MKILGFHYLKVESESSSLSIVNLSFLSFIKMLLNLFSSLNLGNNQLILKNKRNLEQNQNFLKIVNSSSF